MRTAWHVSRLTIFILAGLILATTVEAPAWTLPLIYLDTPLTLQLTGSWLIALALFVLVAAGTDLWMPRSSDAEMPLRRTAPAWALPATIALTGALLIAGFRPLSTRWTLILAGTTVGFSLVLLGEMYVADPAREHAHAVQAGLTALAYALALVVFVTVYGAHVRTALSGTATAVTSFLLALSLLRWPAERKDARWPYALMAALIVGMATWGLNRAAFDALTGGGVLLLEFYLVTGIARQLIQRAFDWRVLVEFAVVIVVGLVLIGVLGGTI